MVFSRKVGETLKEILDYPLQVSHILKDIFIQRSMN
jgi:hypothetical protein